MTDLTIAEACAVLDPPLTTRQLRRRIHALGWKPTGYRHTGRPGRPAATYETGHIMRLHAELFAIPAR